LKNNEIEYNKPILIKEGVNAISYTQEDTSKNQNFKNQGNLEVNVKDNHMSTNVTSQTYTQNNVQTHDSIFNNIKRNDLEPYNTNEFTNANLLNKTDKSNPNKLSVSMD
jgi:hypothetical protein